MKNNKILSADVSTQNIGVCVGTQCGEITYCNTLDLSKTDGKFSKLNIFQNWLCQNVSPNEISAVVIEQAQIYGNNAKTTAKLIEFNSMVSTVCFNYFGFEPTYIPAVTARKLAFPDKKFRDCTNIKDCVVEEVFKVYPDLILPSTKRRYDAADAVVLYLAYLKKIQKT